MDEVTAQMLRSLEQQPGWQAYLHYADELVNEQMEKFWKGAMTRQSGGVTDGELQYRRGLLRGIQMISRSPMLERKKFEATFANQEATD